MPTIEEELEAFRQEWMARTPSVKDWTVTKDRFDAPLLLTAAWLDSATHHGRVDVDVWAHRYPGFISSTHLTGYVDKGRAWIHDIQSPGEERRRFIGTAVLGFAEQIFRRLGATSVAGGLSAQDFHNRPGQRAFYERNHYDVYEKGETGRISKTL